MVRMGLSRGALVVACVALHFAASFSHVQLNFPPSESPHDFLDNARTEGMCGLTGRGTEPSTWKMVQTIVPDFTPTVTVVRAGSVLNVSWSLTYAHQGGFSVALLDSNFNEKQTWNHFASTASGGPGSGCQEQHVCPDGEPEPEGEPCSCPDGEPAPEGEPCSGFCWDGEPVPEAADGTPEPCAEPEMEPCPGKEDDKEDCEPKHIYTCPDGEPEPEGEPCSCPDGEPAPEGEPCSGFCWDGEPVPEAADGTPEPCAEPEMEPCPGKEDDKEDSPAVSNVDPTQQFVLIQLPEEGCEGCHLQFTRQALEWGQTYRFRSCASINIVTDPAVALECAGGCSGHGTCVNGECICDALYDGASCERKNECDADADCGAHAICVDTGPGITTEARRQCYCEEGWFGPIENGRRTCGTASALAIGDPAAWSSAYPASQAAGDDMEVYWKVLEAEGQIEFAIRGKTDSYVSLGFRAATTTSPMEGTCATDLSPNSAHEMTNQDVVVGFAQGSHFRVTDMFTPSRSTPLADAWWGGKDDIADAVGREEGGYVHIKFRRALSTGDTSSQGDYCIAPGQGYLMIWAKGQTAGNLITPPPDGSSDAGFYHRGQLKFHGVPGLRGGQRGVGAFGVVDVHAAGMVAAPPPPGDTTTVGGVRCLDGAVASTLAGYTCMKAMRGAITAQRTYGDTDIIYFSRIEPGVGVHFAVEGPDEGYVSYAWAKTRFAMEDAEAVIGAFDSNGAGVVETYRLVGRSAVREPLFEITGKSLERVGGRLRMAFTRPEAAASSSRRLLQTYTSTIPFDPVTAYDGIYSVGPATGGGAPSFHMVSGRGEFRIVVQEAEASAPAPPGFPPLPPAPPSVDLQSEHIAHGALMTIGWGVVIPIGIAAARYFKHHDPTWFNFHRGVQCLALLLTIIAWAVALAKFETPSSHSHLRLGMAVMVIGICQPLNALVRPGKDHQYRYLWKAVHQALGFVTAIAGVANCFSGLRRYRDLYGGDGPRVIAVVLLVWVVVYLLTCMYLEVRLAKRSPRASIMSGPLMAIGLVPRLSEEDGPAAGKKGIKGGDGTPKGVVESFGGGAEGGGGSSLPRTASPPSTPKESAGALPLVC